MHALAEQLDDLPIPSLNEEQAQVLGKAFWNLVNLYQFTREEQALLLGIKANRERLNSLEKQKTIPLDPDKFLRGSHLLGIHKNLRILYPHNREIVYSWMKTARDLFGNVSAIDFLKQIQ